MKFLIISKPKHMIPPEFTVPLVDAFSAFLDQYSASGKLESVWSFAGTQGGGGIINVDSLEELDAINHWC
jgi:muconolactone delta-isomerase